MAGKAAAQAVSVMGKHKNFGRIAHLFDFEGKNDVSAFIMLCLGSCHSLW